MTDELTDILMCRTATIVNNILIPEIASNIAKLKLIKHTYNIKVSIVSQSRFNVETIR